MAILIFGALGAGFYIANMPDIPSKGLFIFIHKSVGLLILGLLILRFIWRQLNTVPEIPKMPLDFLSKLSAPVLYLSILAMPVSGIAMSQFAGYPISFFGLFTIPTLVEKSPQWAGFFHEMHEISGIILLTLIIIHTLAASFHHYILKDTVFLRMLKNIDQQETEK